METKDCTPAFSKIAKRTTILRFGLFSYQVKDSKQRTRMSKEGA